MTPTKNVSQQEWIGNLIRFQKKYKKRFDNVTERRGDMMTSHIYKLPLALAIVPSYNISCKI